MSCDKKLDQLIEAERQSRFKISLQDDLDKIEELRKKHRQALGELNDYIKSIWRVNA